MNKAFVSRIWGGGLDLESIWVSLALHAVAPTARMPRVDYRHLFIFTSALNGSSVKTELYGLSDHLVQFEGIEIQEKSEVQKPGSNFSTPSTFS